MHALAKIPAAPSSTALAPSSTLADTPAHNAAAYIVAAPANSENITTSRLSQERRHIFSARYA
jgi:hypothetical protein